jgi:hypothetical protein
VQRLGMQSRIKTKGGDARRMQMKRLLFAAAALVALMINAGAMDIAAAQTRGTTCTVNDPTGTPLNVRPAA